MKLETFRAANALEAEIQELKKAKAKAAGGIYLADGISLATILSGAVKTLIGAITDEINVLLEKKEDELKKLLEE